MSQNVTQVDFTEDPLKTLIKELMACYPNANVTKEMLSSYKKELSGLNIENLREAISSLKRSSSFLPTIAEICEESMRVNHKNSVEKYKALYTNGCDTCLGTGWAKITRMIQVNPITSREVPGVTPCECRTKKAS